MKLKKNLVILNTMLLVCIAAVATAPALSAGVSNGQSRQIRGSVTENEMIDNLERVGIKCIYHQGTPTIKGFLAVDSVRMGSSAFYKGIAVGDKIKSLITSNDSFTLTIERNGQPFQVQLRALSPQLATATPLTGAVQQKEKNQDIPLVSVSQPTVPIVDVTQPPTEKDKQKKLTQYDVELIIDVTGSMLDIDGTGAVSKFEWCHEQVNNFAKLMQEYNRTLTITTFNTSYDTEYRCNPARVEEIFASTRPHGNTCLVDPLMDRLDYAIHHRTPGRGTIVAVITDGLPNVPKDPHVVNTALIDFTKRLSSPNDIVLTFLQIGDTFNGKSFCIDLDDNLVNEGAKYDIVDTKTFDELKEEGLTQALIDAVTEKRSVRRTASSRHLKMTAADQAKLKAADAKLHEKMDERKALEKLLNLQVAP